MVMSRGGGGGRQALQTFVLDMADMGLFVKEIQSGPGHCMVTGYSPWDGTSY